MSQARDQRESRRQLGKFYTPPSLASAIVRGLSLRDGMRVLEPACGDGSFVVALEESACAGGLTLEITAVDIEPAAVAACAARAAPTTMVSQHDFFEWSPNGPLQPLSRALYSSRVRPEYDLIIGNPPFGGTIADHLHDPLDEICGFRFGQKIKKESYSLFIIKSVDHLRVGGQLVFICSDTFLTINTMKGLRKFLQETGDVSVERLSTFSEETTQPMAILRYVKTGRKASCVRIANAVLPIEDIEKTGNLSWTVDSELSKYFDGKVVVGDFLVASSGMTIGNNSLFLREIRHGKIHEPFHFDFFDDPITLRRELERARNGILSERKQAEIRTQELNGATRRNIRCREREATLPVTLPDPDYRFYNKSFAGGDLIFAPPTCAIYWRDDGDAVQTFKKNGNWYLHGVGGKPFFGREGITWSLVAQRLKLRYLPPGYILDSGAPCAFVRDGVSRDELLFLMAWGLTNLANRILKEVINHTRNIQGKDFERLPYPVWVSSERKVLIVRHVRDLLASAQSGTRYDNRSPEVRALDGMFAWSGAIHAAEPPPKHAPRKKHLRIRSVEPVALARQRRAEGRAG